MAIRNRKNNVLRMINIIIFFAFIIVLCPIVKLDAAEDTGNNKRNKIESREAESDSGKTSKNEKSETENDKATKNTLYDYEKPTVEEESYVWMVVKTIIVLGALVGGFYYFYRFVTKKTGLHSVGRDVAKVLSVVPLGPNKFLQVIDLAGRILVIGVCDSNISLITEIQGKDDIDRVRLLSSKSSPIAPGGFQDFISKFLSGLLKKPGGPSSMHYEAEFPETEIHAENIDRMDYLKKQRERLKKINKNHEEE